MLQTILILSLMVIALLLVAPQNAGAYIGPGAAFIGAILLAIVGFVWYPIKRLLAMMRRKRMHHKEGAPS